MVLRRGDDALDQALSGSGPRIGRRHAHLALAPPPGLRRPEPKTPDRADRHVGMAGHLDGVGPSLPAQRRAGEQRVLPWKPSKVSALSDGPQITRSQGARTQNARGGKNAAGACPEAPR
jgi:hypothetical protein